MWSNLHPQWQFIQSVGILDLCVFLYVLCDFHFSMTFVIFIFPIQTVPASTWHDRGFADIGQHVANFLLKPQETEEASNIKCSFFTDDELG